MRSSFPSVGIVTRSPAEHKSRPQPDNAGDDLADDVDGGRHELSVAQQLEAFKRERRERGEASKHSDEQECARLRPEDGTLLRETNDDPEQDAADHIHREGAEWKERRREARDQRRKHVARHGAQRPAEPDEQKSHTRQNTDGAQGPTHAIVKDTRKLYRAGAAGTAREAERRTRRSGPGARHPRAASPSDELPPGHRARRARREV